MPRVNRIDLDLNQAEVHALRDSLNTTRDELSRKADEITELLLDKDVLMVSGILFEAISYT